MSPREALLKYLNNTRKDIIDEMKFRGMYLTGKTADNLEIDLEDNKETIEGFILGDVAFMTLLNGRKPGVMPPIAPIARWIQMRNLNLSPWAVAKSIAKKGTAIYQGKRAPLNIRAVEQIHMQEFQKDLAQAYQEQIINKIREAQQ